MDGLELYALRRNQTALTRRLEILESILEQSGIIDSILNPGGGTGPIGPQVDPVPWDFTRIGDRDINLTQYSGWRLPRPGDPATFDLARLTKVQLEFALHSIEAERTRLAAAEQLIKDQIKEQAAPAAKQRA